MAVKVNGMRRGGYVERCRVLMTRLVVVADKVFWRWKFGAVRAWKCESCQPRCKARCEAAARLQDVGEVGPSGACIPAVQWSLHSERSPADAAARCSGIFSRLTSRDLPHQPSPSPTIPPPLLALAVACAIPWPSRGEEEQKNAPTLVVPLASVAFPICVVFLSRIRRRLPRTA